MAEDRTKPSKLDQVKHDTDYNMRIICLGDSTVGKSKLMERFFMGRFQPQQLFTYVLTLYKHRAAMDSKIILTDLWNMAGQEQFQRMHARYYHKTHGCIMFFDVQRKVPIKTRATGTQSFESSGQRSHAPW